ncbi:hypothetical protein [Vibrio olivae]|uniref:Chemotaxis protein n=1 Tax=Vibrio olivae TaxID=1243002 RepID=A0ABV5HTB7_9VIBR
MDAFNYHSFNHLVGDVSALLFTSSKHDIMKYQGSINQLTQAIEYVRHHRALTHAALSGEAYSRKALNHLQGNLKRSAEDIVKNRVIGKKVDRIALKNHMLHLVDSIGELSLPKSLVVHGKVIREMIFQIDEQMLTAMTKANKLNMAGDYNDQWQSVMSAVEALTQYRLSIVAMHLDPRDDMLVNRAKLLHKKMVKVSSCYQGYHRKLEECMIELEHYTKIENMESSVEFQQHLYGLCSEISASLIEVYKQITDHTCTKVFNACVD